MFAKWRTIISDCGVSGTMSKAIVALGNSFSCCTDNLESYYSRHVIPLLCFHIRHEWLRRRWDAELLNLSHVVYHYENEIATIIFYHIIFLNCVWQYLLYNVVLIHLRSIIYRNVFILLGAVFLLERFNITDINLTHRDICKCRECILVLCNILEWYISKYIYLPNESIAFVLKNSNFLDGTERRESLLHEFLC